MIISNLKKKQTLTPLTITRIRRRENQRILLASIWINLATAPNSPNHSIAIQSFLIKLKLPKLNKIDLSIYVLFIYFLLMVMIKAITDQIKIFLTKFGFNIYFDSTSKINLSEFNILSLRLFYL